MFKAVNVQDHTEVIILDSAWMHKIDLLRDLANRDQLICQGCRQPVRVRAGTIKQWHFAHKHLRDCSYGHDSPLLLQLRAILYTRLESEFGPAVTLEKQIDGVTLPRPIDCWVQREQGNVAYWIVEAALRPQIRDALRAALGKIDAQVHWLFASGMLRRDENEETAANLTTTERELMVTTPFDAELAGVHFIKGGTLHYLNPKTEELKTFRSLGLIHAPQMYEGRAFASALSEVLVAKKTGEFAHPGERERLHELQKEMARVKQVLPHQSSRPSDAFSFASTSDLPPPKSYAAEKRMLAISASREGTCVFCGEKTTEWWYHEGATGMCKCRQCQQKGRA